MALARCQLEQMLMVHRSLKTLKKGERKKKLASLASIPWYAINTPMTAYAFALLPMCLVHRSSMWFSGRQEAYVCKH